MSAATFPPFSGDHPLCPKCGHIGAFTKFMAHGHCSHDIEHVVVGVAHNERLHRECERCEYAWDEATVEDTQVRQMRNRMGENQ